MTPITFVTFKWAAPAGYRSSFHGRHVDILRRMVARHYSGPHRFACITDDPEGILEPDVEVFDLWDDFAHVPNPNGRKNPSCYRRLRLFARNTGEWLGERIVCLDLDAVICGSLDELLDRPEDFVCWGDTNPKNPYNGSMWMLRTGTRPQVWEDFNPISTPAATRRAGFFGSDQAWLAHCLGPGEARWTAKDGVYSFRNDILRSQSRRLPTDARAVFFHGRYDPWDAEAVRLAPWIAEHYR